MIRLLITGAAGFVGHHLMAALQNQVDYLNGLDRVADTPHIISADLSQPDQLRPLIAKIQPTHVIHLAGVLGNTSYETLYQVNVVGTINLLETLRLVGCPARVLLASSSGVYGATQPEQNPLTEDCPLRPISHYGASKLAQENVAWQYYRAYQLPVFVMRTFNMLGPGLSPALFASMLARQIAQIEQGQSTGPILVGNLYPRRDYVDVRDAVTAYMALLELGQPGRAYNVCSGQSWSAEECLAVLVNLANCPITVQQDPSRMRAEEIADQQGDATLLHDLTGWQPTISVEQSLTDLLVYWRAEVSRGCGISAT